MNTGFVQIYKENYICSTTRQDIREILVLVTGEKQYLKKSGIVNEDCFQMVSQSKFVDVLGTYAIPLDATKRIFRHAKDKILDIIILDHIFCVVADTGILYTGNLDENIPDLAQREIILKGSKPWLKNNNLECF